MATPVFFPGSRELSDLREAVSDHLAGLANERANQPPDNLDMQIALAAIQRLAEEILLLRQEVDQLRAKQG